jgi:hypothetical protein
MECSLRSGCVAILIGDGHGDDYTGLEPHRRFPDLIDFTAALREGAALVK